MLVFAPQGLQYFNSKLKVLERRQQQVKELRVKHEALWEELEDTKARLMMDPRKWIGECEYLLLQCRCRIRLTTCCVCVKRLE